MTKKNFARQFLACALFAVVWMLLFASNARAERLWEDTYRAKLWPNSYSACMDGEALARIGAYQRANPTIGYRHRSLNVNEYIEDEESLCRYVIERSLGSRWVTVETGSRTHFRVGANDPCTMGATDSSGNCLPKSAGPPCEPCNPSNPINSGTGNKFQLENDYTGAATFPLVVRRYYNSLSRENGPSGLSWRHYYERRVLTIAVTAEAPSRVRIYRHDGKRYEFNLVSGVWVPDGDVNYRLATVATTPIGWTVRTPDDDVELYDFEGQLVSITKRNGQRQTLTYDYSNAAVGGRLQSVTDQDGRVLQFAYDANNRISTVTLPNTAETITYAYDSTGRLTSVTYPGSTSRIYHYNESGYTGSSQPTALTGITDESGIRFAHFYYDAQNRAIRSEHAGGVNRTAIAYGTAGAQTITDALGTARTFNYETRGTTLVVPSGVSQVCSHCPGATASVLQYDTNANITLRRDFKNVDTVYEFDTTRNLETSRTEASGTALERTILTAWHPAFRLPTQVDEPNRRTTFAHDTSGNVLTKTATDVSVTPNVSRTWTFTYNAQGKAITADGPRIDVNDVTTYTYYACTTGSECGQLQAITNARGQTTTYNTYNLHGRPLQITDANGVETHLVYDSRQRVTSSTIGTETTLYEYWPTGLLKRVTLPDGRYVQSTYDNAHRLTKVEDGQGNRIEYALDNLGNRTAESHYDSSNALVRTSTRAYNNLNQLFREVGSAGTPAVTTLYGYDANGSQTTTNAPLGRNKTNAFDELNRLVQITDAGGDVTQFGYDTNDNLTSVLDPNGLTTAYTYDGFGDLVQVTSPDTATTIHTYDSNGNVLTSTDARGKTGTYTYDELGRTTQVVHPDRTLTFTYDAGANGVGRLTGASDENHSLAWTYDELGRVTGKGQTVTGITKSIGYGYTNGNRTSVITPSGQTLNYGYTNGRITGISVNGATLLNTVLYDSFGPARSWAWSNATLAIREFDLDGNPASIDSAGAYTYSYDDAFRITGIADSVDATKSWTYGYDLLDRLSSALASGRTIGYTHDANGNRQSQSGNQNSTYTLIPGSNRLASVVGDGARTYAYDPAGNVLGYGTLTYEYSDFGRLISTTDGNVKTDYIINALGQRVKKSNAGDTSYFVYDESGHLVGEYDSAGALIQEIVWMEDTPVAVLRPSGASVEVLYIHTDHLNTPRRISRPSDNIVVWRWDSDPFGTTAPSEDPDGDADRFTFNLRLPGQYYDAESGLHYNSLRDYDPAIGRYIESDPIGLRGGLNTYAYVGGDPVSYSDVTGEQRIRCPKAVYARLRLAVVVACKDTFRACQQDDGCEELRFKITVGRLCIVAQETLTRVCFPNDPTHKQRISDMENALKKCRTILSSKPECCKDSGSGG